MQKHEVPPTHLEERPPLEELPGPDIEMPQHIRGYIPNGQEVVMSEEDRVAEELIGDWHADRAAEELMDDIEYGDHAEPLGRRARIIGKLALIKDAAERRFVGGLEYHQTEHDDFFEADHARREASSHGKERDKGLDQVRTHLQEFETFQRDEIVDGEVVPNKLRGKLNSYLENELPDIFQNEYELWVERLDRHEIPGPKDRVDWLSKSSDDMLLNFLQWHNDRIDRMNADPAFQERVTEMKQQVKDHIKAGVMQPDGLPREALLSFNRIDNVRVIAGDIFDTDLKELLGYFKHEPGHIVVGEDFDEDTFEHEIYHAALGDMNNTIMAEAMTEHLTLASRNGDYRTMNPDKRDDKGTYVKFRGTNDRILKSGIKEVPIESQIACYIERDKDGPKSRKFHQELNEAYGGIVDVAQFVEYQMTAGYWRAKESHPDMPHHKLMDLAATDVSRSMILLGNLAKGSSYDQLRTGFAKGQNTSTGIWFEQLDRVQEYILQSQSQPVRPVQRVHQHAH
jgi:hypothetical protein